MFNFENELEREIQSIAKPKPTFLFPETQDSRVLVAASKLTPFVNVLLPASREKMKETVTSLQPQLEIPIDDFLAQLCFVDVTKLTEEKKRFAQALSQISSGKKWQLNESQARELLENPLNFSIMAIRLGYAEAILGGLVFPSKDYFVPCLRMLKKEKTVFELGLFVLPGEHPAGIFEQNIAVFSDVAINLMPDAEALANIAVGTCRIVRDIVPENILPQINGAIVSYSTKGSGEGPSVEVVREAGTLIPGKLKALCNEDARYKSIQIEEELQVSVALSERAAQKKIQNYEAHPAAGHANVLIVTNLDFGNSLYHLYATTWPQSLKLLQVGGIFGQALDFSRSSSTDDVVLAGKALALQHLKRRDYQGTPNHF